MNFFLLVSFATNPAIIQEISLIQMMGDIGGAAPEMGNFSEEGLLVSTIWKRASKDGKISDEPAVGAPIPGFTGNRIVFDEEMIASAFPGSWGGVSVLTSVDELEDGVLRSSLEDSMKR